MVDCLPTDRLHMCSPAYWLPELVLSLPEFTWIYPRRFPLPYHWHRLLDSQVAIEQADHLLGAAC